MEDSPEDLAQEAEHLSRLQQQMDQLTEMHMQLRNLRDAVPSLIRPWRTHGMTPEQTYAEFAKAATGAVNNTREFVALMKSEESQEVLRQAQKSKAENPDGISSWLAEQHPDWTDRPQHAVNGDATMAAIDMKRETSLAGQDTAVTAMNGELGRSQEPVNGSGTASLGS